MRARASLPVRDRRQAGFSLVELLVAMVIVVEILVAGLTVFDVHNKMARVQTQITDMQQSLRIAQYDMVKTTRMAGRGALPAVFAVASTPSTTWLASRALEVRNNLIDDDDREIARGFTDSPKAIAGTDALVVRGCMSGLMFQILSADFQPDPDTPGTFDTGLLTVRRAAIAGGREQSLAQFLEAGFDAPIVLQSSVNRGQIAIVEVAAVAGDADTVVLTLDFVSQEDPPNPLIGLPDPDIVPSFLCVLEEYRYYIREHHSIPGDDSSELLPRLARARMIPGTELPHSGLLANLSLDLADEIIDLQVALGFDTDRDLDGAVPGAFDDDTDQAGNDDVLYEGADDGARALDDWLWNSGEDDPTEAQYLVNAGPPARSVRLYNVRITTVGRTSRPDPGYVAPDFDADADFDWVEDNDYDVSPANDWKQGLNRHHRRRVLQTLVDLRNI